MRLQCSANVAHIFFPLFRWSEISHRSALRMLHTFFFPCLGGRKLVTAERERPSAPRFQERQRFPRSGKMHSKCRSSFPVRRSSIRRSRNSGDYWSEYFNLLGQ